MYVALLLPAALLLLAPAAAGLLIRLQLPGVTQGPLPSSYFFEATCGEPTWVSWAGREVSMPHPRPGCAAAPAHALHLLRAQPDALGSGADPLLLQTQPLPPPPPGPPLGRQLVLSARSSLALIFSSACSWRWQSLAAFFLS